MSFLQCWDTELGERYTHDIIPNRTVCIEMGKLDGNRTVWKNPDSGITFDNVGIAYIALFQVGETELFSFDSNDYFFTNFPSITYPVLKSFRRAARPIFMI